MVLPLVAAGLGVAGMGVNAYADHKRKKAMGRAMDEEDRAIGEHGAAEAAAAERAREQQMGLTRRKFGALDDMFAGFTAPASDPRAQERIDSTLALGTPQAQQTNGQQTAWSRRAQAPVDARTQNLVTMAGNAAQQDAQTQQRGDALSGFGRADQNLGVESRDFNALAAVEGSARDRAWQQRLRQLQSMFDHAQGVGGDLRTVGAALGASSQLVGGMSADAGPARKPIFGPGSY